MILAAGVTGLLTIHFGNQIFEFFHELGVHKFDEPDRLAEVYKKHDKVSTYLYYSTEATLLGRIVLAFFKNSYCEAKENYSDERYFCGMMLPFWFPFKMNIVAKIWIFLSTNSMFAVYIPIASLGYFVVYGISDLIVLRMQKMKQMMKKLDFKGSNEMVHEQLVECIEYHSELWKLVIIFFYIYQYLEFFLMNKEKFTFYQCLFTRSEI